MEDVIFIHQRVERVASLFQRVCADDQTRKRPPVCNRLDIVVRSAQRGQVALIDATFSRIERERERAGETGRVTTKIKEERSKRKLSIQKSEKLSHR